MTAAPTKFSQGQMPHGDGPSDQQLLRRYLAGDANAFATIVRRYQCLVFASAFRRLRGDRHAAEDVAQAVFILLAQRAGQLAQVDAPLAGWLHRTAGYAALNAARMARRRARHEKAVIQMNPTHRESRHTTALEGLIDEAIDRLSTIDRSAVLARYVQGHSLEQVAVLLGVSVQAARKRVQRALEKLRKRLVRRNAEVTVLAIAAALEDGAIAAAPGDEFTAGVMTNIHHPAGEASAIAKGASNMIWWTQARRAATVTLASAAVLAAAAVGLSHAPIGPESFTGKVAPEASRHAWTEPKTISINDDSQRDHDCFDLDTGKTGTPGRPFRDRADGRAWFSESGMDAHCETSDEPGENGLYGMGVAWVLVPNEDFDDLPADEVDRRLAGVDPEWDNRADADGGMPVTYLFKTKDGGQGIIQFVEIHRGPDRPRLTVRWKLTRSAR